MNLEKNTGDPAIVTLIVRKNTYIGNIIKNSKLHVVHDKNVIEQPSRLFHLFLPIYVFITKFAIGQIKSPSFCSIQGLYF